jgi:hypothetical protein
MRINLSKKPSTHRLIDAMIPLEVGTTLRLRYSLEFETVSKGTNQPLWDYARLPWNSSYYPYDMLPPGTFRVT